MTWRFCVLVRGNVENGGLAMDEVVTVDVAMGRLERLEGFGLAVHPERCARVRHRHASCARCAEACTSGALAFRDGALVVNEALCVGCGTCATVCPTCAIEARHPADAQLLAAARRALGGVAGESATVTFACHRAFAEAPTACAQAGAIELACLSRMEESLAMRLFADGAQRVRLLHGTCAGCPRENGFASVELVRQTMMKLIEAWGLTCAYDVEQVAAEQEVAAECAPQQAVRLDSVKGEGAAELAQDVGADGVEDASQALGFGHAVRSDGVNVAARESDATVGGGCRQRSAFRARPAHVQADGTLPHFVPLRRHALLDALADLGGKPATAELDTRLWGHIAIDMGKCRSCKMCAVFCPTGALQKYVGENGHGGVEHYPAECVHCGLCQDICPAGAIVSSTRVPTDVLAGGKTERYPMPDPVWTTGPDQILRKMTPQIHSREVQHSY